MWTIKQDPEWSDWLILDSRKNQVAGFHTEYEAYRYAADRHVIEIVKNYNGGWSFTHKSNPFHSINCELCR